MKKATWVTTVFAVMLLTLTACGKEEPFDAKSYVQGSLDAFYHCDYKQHATDVGVSAKDLEQELVDQFLNETEDLVKESGFKATEEEVTEYTNLETEARKRVNYKVLEAKENEDGTYVVDVEVTPLGVYDNLTTIFSQHMQEAMANGVGEDGYMAVMNQSLKESIDAAREYDPVTISMHVTCKEKDKKKIYSVNESDLAEFDVIALHQ